MGKLQRYKKKPDAHVIAIQLNVDTTGFSYNKWGAEQFCKPGDWIVNNNGDTYTIDQETFSNTYEQSSPGKYVKTSCVWAEIADHAGAIKTKEDGWAVKPETFQTLYELVE